MRTFEKQRQEHKLGYLLVCISVLFISCQSFKIIPDIYEIMFCRYEYNSNFFINCLPIPLNIITFQQKEGYTQQNVSMKRFKNFCILCIYKIGNQHSFFHFSFRTTFVLLLKIIRTSIWGKKIMENGKKLCGLS